MAEAKKKVAKKGIKVATESIMDRMLRGMSKKERDEFLGSMGFAKHKTDEAGTTRSYYKDGGSVCGKPTGKGFGKARKR